MKWFTQHSRFTLVGLVWLKLTNSLVTADEVILLSECGSGRATGYAESNKIITAAGKTHISWLDSVPDGFEVKIRTLDHKTGILSPSYLIGSAQDNHGGPALVIDSQGHLHIAYYPHSRPMRYRKSLRPHDGSAWEPEIEFGERLTYPNLMVGPDDTLYLTARRRGDSQTKWTLELYSKPPGGQWSAPTTLLVANELSYAHFQCALAWGPDHRTLHLASRMYGDQPRWGYLLGYLQSPDFGKTWQWQNGKPVSLPADKHSLEPVVVVSDAQREQYASSSALRGEAIAVDSQNRPYLLYNTLGGESGKVRQAWIATPDAQGEWQRISLNDKLDALPTDWGLGTPGGISVDANGRLSVVLTMADDALDRGLWGSQSSEVIYAASDDGGQTFHSRIISPQSGDTASWLPNLEKPTGFNHVSSNPGVVFLFGDKGHNNDAIVSNRVYFWRVSHPINR